MRIMNIQRGFSIQYNTMPRWKDFVSPHREDALGVWFNELYSQGRKTVFEMDERETREVSEIATSDGRFLTEEQQRTYIPNEEDEETYIQFTYSYNDYLRRKGESFRVLRALDAKIAGWEDAIQEYFESMIGFRTRRQRKKYLNILYLIYRDIRDFSKYKSQWIAIFDAFTLLNRRWEDQRQSDLMSYPPIADDQNADTPRSSIAPQRRPQGRSSDTWSILEQEFIY